VQLGIQKEFLKNKINMREMLLSQVWKDSIKNVLM
jgi:hypothetical protein